MSNTQEQMRVVPGLAGAIHRWRVARRQAQRSPTQEATGFYCAATDRLAQALLGDLAREPGSQAVFERFHAWLIENESDMNRPPLKRCISKP